jgi:2-dehydropantoate 2-reductase
VRGDQVRVAVLGVGAIGGLVAARLATTDADLVLYARGDTARMLASVGLRLEVADGKVEQVLPDRWVVSEGEPLEPLLGCADVALVCGKADSTPALARIAEALLRPNGIAVSLQNGIGHAQVLTTRLGRHRVFGGSTTHAALRSTPGELRWTGRGSIELGTFPGSDLVAEDARVRGLFELFFDAGLSPEWVDDIDRTLVVKLLLNVAINPLAAICGVRNGEILSRSDLRDQAQAAMHEAALVVAAGGIDLSDIDLERRLDEVLGATADNRCSMLQDVMAGRPTEIDAICGEVVRMAEEHGIPTPLNQQLLTMVKGIEHSLQTD